MRHRSPRNSGYGFSFRAFRQGMHDLKVWPNVEADPTSQSTTPGKTKDSNDQMSRLAKVSGSGYYCFYAPNFGEVEGAYWFGPVRPSVHLSVRSTWQLRNSRTAYARIMKFYMWHEHEK